MITSLISGTNIPVLENVISFAQARHQVLAGNIANLDTPGYRVRDLSVENFQQRLKEVIESGQDGARSITPGVVTNHADDALRHVKDSMKTILFHDGSNVGLEQQVSELSKNQLMHNMAIAVMTRQFQLLETVISERV